MNSLLDWFINYCISNALISKDNEALFRYGLEKRLCTLVVLIPFAVIAIYLSGLWTAISYIISFFYLRSQANGYHAKTHWGCFVGSLLLELLFLMVIKPMLNTIWVLVLVSLASLAVFLFAPYNHPMMNLDDQEYAACKKASVSIAPAPPKLPRLQRPVTHGNMSIALTMSAISSVPNAVATRPVTKR